MCCSPHRFAVRTATVRVAAVMAGYYTRAWSNIKTRKRMLYHHCYIPTTYKTVFTFRIHERRKKKRDELFQRSSSPFLQIFDQVFEWNSELSKQFFEKKKRFQLCILFCGRGGGESSGPFVGCGVYFIFTLNIPTPPQTVCLLGVGYTVFTLSVRYSIHPRHFGFSISWKGNDGIS